MVNRAVHYLKGVRTELKKVNWPTKAETTRFTIGVVLISTAVAVFFAALDYIFSIVLDRFIL